jgi:hypothetical protein
MPGQRALFLSRRPIHLDVKRYRYPMGWKSEKLNPECSKARFPDVPGQLVPPVRFIPAKADSGTKPVKLETCDVIEAESGS